METARLHDGILDINRFGIRAHRLSQVASVGAPVPPALVIADAALAVESFSDFKAELESHLIQGKLYTLRASPGRADWGGPHTFLALGMNDDVFNEMIAAGDVLTACELYRQAIASFGLAVSGLDGEPFETLVAQFGSYSPDENEERAIELLKATRELYKAETDEDFPQDPIEQLAGAVRSMARQWHAPTAKILRNAKGAPEDAHLALVLQEMVHGLGATNGVGRIQAVDPESGSRKLNGMFVKATLSAAGANPSKQWRIEKNKNGPSLEQFDSKAFQKVIAQIAPITKVIKDAPELKFVIENGKVFITEALLARRSPRASLQILLDLVEAEALSREDAITRIDPSSIAAFLHPQIDPDAPRDILAQGVAASPGAATGAIVFSAEHAMSAHSQGQDVILVRHETSPDDIRGMHAAKAILTVRGGMTSHAAVIARGIGLPCVVGAQNLRIDAASAQIITSDGNVLNSGDIITIDGSNGDVLRGAPAKIEALLDERIDQVLRWANDLRRMGIRVNADTPDDARRALRFGVDGIGLCRTEHMFFAQERLRNMRRMILAETAQERREILTELEPGQTADFIEIFEIMKGLPVTIRLLDPPLHEFLPKTDDDLPTIAETIGVSSNDLARRIRALHEFNPMLGMRGVRLGLIMPEIYEMQARAIFAAAAEVNKSAEQPVVPEIMIPLVSANREVELVKSRIDKIAANIAKKSGVEVPYRLGVMVETPRAALRAGDLAKSAEFLSMGTNDLTQMTYGLSRDDAGRFMREYVNTGVFQEDPFLTIDIEGVGELLHEAVKRGRESNRSLLIGLCGEQGGDPNSIHFCELENFDYVSCSPYRVPVAQIAAAQAHILLKKKV